MADQRPKNTSQTPKYGKHAAPQQESPRTVAAASAHSDSGTRMHSTHPRGQRAYGETKQSKRRIPAAAKVIIGVVIAIALAAGAFLVWDYLFRYDDAKDFQGQWKIEGSTSSIVITDSEIRLTDSISFEYELDTFTKTLTYNYKNFSGEGMYVFSPERDVLTLTDVAPESDGNEDGQDSDEPGNSMRLLKVSDQAIGEPETANNNDMSDANSQGVDVLEGSVSSSQAQQDIDAAEDSSQD